MTILDCPDCGGTHYGSISCPFISALYRSEHSGTMNRRGKEFGFTEEGIVMALWRQRLDTVAIARQLGRPEYEIANRLLHLRDQEDPELHRLVHQVYFGD